MRLPGRRHLEQEEVLAAAAEIAIELGMHAVSIAAVVERLGVQRKAVAALWPGDDALVAMTFSRIVSAELTEVQDDVLSQESPVEQLAVLLGSLAEPVPHLDALWVESWSLGRRNRALGAAVRSEEDAWHTLIESVVRSGIASGDFTADAPEEVATHLLAVVDGVNAYSLVGYDTDVDRLRLLHAVARTHLGATLPTEDQQAESAPSAS
ncbi:TetR/AcrR family transcriptional regulator [Amnibacterium sp.]|uniref:TetR/AcrR family transcriptional regulator n=1 Tax=Amnibacterium sp. TaxID=1872496 RepID=UPI00262CC03A|nr:TetR family transcriptional regulator C-terminal domain-containing protein [Amnibacterium sp.]MCU1472008.1 transcriptional regulator, TetR family [Amnibacterium sp.]